MPLPFVFWLLMLIWLVFGLWRNWPFGGSPAPFGDLLLFIVIGLLGWRVFGFPIQG